MGYFTYLYMEYIYWGYNPFTNHLLTSWDILVENAVEPSFYLLETHQKATHGSNVPMLPHFKKFLKDRKTQLSFKQKIISYQAKSRGHDMTPSQKTPRC